MKLQEMLAEGFIKIEGQSAVYKQTGENLVVVCEDLGNGEYDFGDLIILNGKLSAEEQIKLEQEYRRKFGEIPVI
jgi:hypothetical protein